MNKVNNIYSCFFKLIGKKSSNMKRLRFILMTGNLGMIYP